MDTMTKQSKTLLIALLVSGVTKNLGHERTLAAHMCPRKRRWADRDMTHVRLGYRVFQMSYEMNTAVSKPRAKKILLEASTMKAL